MKGVNNRIPLLADEQIDPEILNLLKKYPRINIYTLLAHSPTVCKPWIELINGIYNSGLSPRLREIALVRIGVVTDASYELHQHHFIALKNGVGEQDIQAIIKESPVSSLDPHGNLICLAVDELRKNFSLTDDTFKKLSELFNSKDLVSMGVAIATYFAVAILTNFSRLEIETSNPLKDFKGFNDEM